MMKTLLSLVAVPVLAFSLMSAQADDVEKRTNPVKDLIQAHMLETGYITQDDIDARIAEKEEVKAMINALKEAGDDEATKALREELHAAKDEHREAVAAYIEANEDLSEEISVLVAELREERKAARAERKAARGL